MGVILILVSALSVFSSNPKYISYGVLSSAQIFTLAMACKSCDSMWAGSNL